MPQVLTREGNTTTDLVTFVMIECYLCGTPFMVPHRLREYCQRSKDMFYCPNGHTQSYTKSTEQTLREKITTLEEKERQRQSEIQKLEGRITDEMIARARVERKLNRVHKGVCPCCNRSFVNLQRHMKTKHSEVVTPKK